MGIEIKDLFDFEYQESRDVLTERLTELIAKSSDEEIRNLYRLAKIISK